MMCGFWLRVFFLAGLFLASTIPATISDNFVVKSEVGTKDKVRFLNSSCQVASGSKICESFGAQGVVLDGKNCSCSCPQEASTFGVDGENCKCLPNNISYGGCPKFSQIEPNVLKRNSTTKLFFPTKNCSLAVLYRPNNGSWITVKNTAGIIQFSQSGELNGSSVYVLKVSNSVEDFQGVLYNVIVQCPEQNSTCLQLKLPSKMTCPFMLSSTRAPNTTTPMANSTAPLISDNPSGLSGGEIAAIVVSCLVFLGIILFILFLWVRRKRQQRIKNDRRESRQQMTLDQDVERRPSEPCPVVFSRPNPASNTQRKDSANLGFEPDAGNTCNDDDYEDPDYDLPIDESHSMISDFFNKIKRPLSVKKSISKNNDRKAEKPDNEDDDEYQVMENLEKPDNLENTVVYENTRREFVKDEPKPEVKQPTFKKQWITKLKKKGKKPEAQGRKENEKELPKKEAGDNIELENVYENNEIIREHKGPSKTPIHEHRTSYSNDVPAKEDDEEGPPPPPRSASLEKVLDKPVDHRPIPSPRLMKNNLPNIQRNDDFNYENDNATENDPSELYENTRKSSYPKPPPRIKR